MSEIMPPPSSSLNTTMTMTTSESTRSESTTIKDEDDTKEFRAMLERTIKDKRLEVAALNIDVGYRHIEEELARAKKLREALGTLIFHAFTHVTREESQLLNRLYETAASVEKRLQWRAEAWRGIAEKNAQVEAAKKKQVKT